ncbi:MAG: TonB-dependent receptor [Thiobacillus sp.]
MSTPTRARPCASSLSTFVPGAASTLALALSAAFNGNTIAAELPVYIGAPIVVTSSRFEEPLGGQPANLTVITRQQIEHNPAATLPEILADYAGIGVRDLFGNNASNSTVDLRGFGAAAGQNTLILIDGRRLNDIDLSGVVWSALPLSAIERVEVIRGGASVLYGPGAVGGVINIITRSPLGKPNEASVALRAGSFATNDVQVYGNLAGKQMGITLAANRHRSDGYRDNNQTRQESLYGDARWKLPSDELIFKFGVDKLDQRLPGARLVQPSIGLNQLATDRKGTSTPKDWASRDGWQLGLTGNHKLAQGEATVDLGYRNKEQTSYFDFGGFPDYRNSELDVLSLSPRVKFLFDTGSVSHEWIVGVDLSQWDYDLRTSNAASNIGQPINRIKAEQRNTGIYVRDQMQLTPALSVNLGARTEWFRINAQDNYDATAPGAFFGSEAPDAQQREREYAWEIGTRYRVAPSHLLYAKAGRSFRFATVDEIYEFSPVFSREFQFLKPQTAQDAELGWELGTAQQGGRAALYYAKVRDEIHLDPYKAGIGNTNLPPLNRYGLELEGRTQWGPVTLAGAYTLAYARFTGGVYNGENLDGKNVPLVSRHKLALNLTWKLGAATRLLTSTNYYSSQYLDNDEANTLGVKIPAYTVSDLKLDHQIGNWTFAVAVNNVFDEDYYTYAVRSSFTPDRYAAYPLPGRSGWVSAEYKFK